MILANSEIRDEPEQVSTYGRSRDSGNGWSIKVVTVGTAIALVLGVFTLATTSAAVAPSRTEAERVTTISERVNIRPDVASVPRSSKIVSKRKTAKRNKRTVEQSVSWHQPTNQTLGDLTGEPAAEIFKGQVRWGGLRTSGSHRTDEPKLLAYRDDTTVILVSA